jgi:UDP-glucose:(heptosyl)LPS alpha-1,3-glucosyltransferase
MTERVAASGRYEVHVFAHTFGQQVHASIRRHLIPRFPFTHIGKIMSYTWMAMRLARRDRFEVVHTHDRLPNQDVATLHGGCHAAYLEAILASIDDLRRRARERGKARHRLALALEARQFAPGHHHLLLAVSDMVRQEVIRHYNVPEAHVRVIHNGVDLKEFTPALRPRYRDRIRTEFGLHVDDILALFVGSGFERKGVRELMAALAQSRGDAPRLHVLIAGRGNLRRYSTLARELGIADRVTFAGERRDINRLYAAADLFCLPTHYDPCSLTVLEALASGLPVITTRSNGASECITPGENGFVIAHPADTPALAEAFAALSDPALCARMGHAARAAAEGRSWERVVAEIMRVYEEVMARKTG